MRINKFNDFVTQVYEVSINNTYLASAKSKINSTKTSKFRGKFGKVFAGAQTSSDKSWRLKFESTGNQKFRVKFPADFSKHFVFKTTDDEQTSLQAELDEILSNSIIVIQKEDTEYRTHFPGGIPDELMGIGLGYIIYEEFIKFLGFAGSYPGASDEAELVWSKIAQDPDFYGLVTERSVLVVWKDCPDENRFGDRAEDTFYSRIENILQKPYEGNFVKNNFEKISEIQNKDISNTEKAKQYSKLLDSNDNFYARIDDGIFDKFESVVELVVDEFYAMVYSHLHANRFNSHQSLKKDLDNFFIKSRNLEELKKYYQEKIKPDAEELEKQKILGRDGKKPLSVIEHLKNIYRNHFMNLESRLKETYEEYGYEEAKNFFDKTILPNLQFSDIPEYVSGKTPQKKLKLQITSYQTKHLSDKIRKTFTKNGLEATQKICDELKDALKDIKEEIDLDYTWANNIIGKYFKDVSEEDVEKIKSTPSEHIDLHLKIIIKLAESKIKNKIKKDYRSLVNKIHYHYLNNGVEATINYSKELLDKILKDSPNFEKELVYDESNYNIDRAGKNLQLTVEEHLKKRLEKYLQKEVERPKETEKPEATTGRKTKFGQYEEEPKRPQTKIQAEPEIKEKPKKGPQKQPETPKRIKKWWEFWK